MSNSATDLLLGPIAWAELAYYLFAWLAFAATGLGLYLAWAAYKDLSDGRD